MYRVALLVFAFGMGNEEKEKRITVAHFRPGPGLINHTCGSRLARMASPRVGPTVAFCARTCSHRPQDEASNRSPSCAQCHRHCASVHSRQLVSIHHLARILSLSTRARASDWTAYRPAVRPPMPHGMREHIPHSLNRRTPT